MAKLAELAENYRDAAVLLRMGMADIKEQMEHAKGYDKAYLQNQLNMVRQMLRECRATRKLCEEYYKGNGKNSG